LREIVLDTETTGLDPKGGDRLVEIGGIELLNGIPTGRIYHQYINPERSMPMEAFRVHGISEEMLRDKPVFAAVAAEFVAFAEDAVLVIHNADFDIGFLNMELGRVGLPPITPDRVVDSLKLARRKHPAGPNSLDALCSRYRIDNSARTKHGALLDAELLAEVYMELLGGRQAALVLGGEPLPAGRTAAPLRRGPARTRAAPLPPRLTEAERAAHRAFVAGMGSAAIWLGYDEPG